MLEHPNYQKSLARRKVLALGLDAPSHDLFLRWMAEGKLPHLRALQRRSARFTIASVKRYSNEHCWIPLLTGQSRDRWNHWLDHWDTHKYEFNEASLFDWIQAPLFYARGDECRVVAFDLTAPVVKGVQGIQVSGWATELNESYPRSDPPELLDELIARYGPDPKLDTAHGITNRLSMQEGVSHTIPSLYQAAEMAHFVQTQVWSVERRTRACLDLMRRGNWDLFITLYSEIHAAGHLLWHLSQPHPLNVLRQGAIDPLLTIYQAVDRSVGELLQEIDDDVLVVLYSIDEIVPDCLENARAVMLPEFLYRWNFPGKAALAQGDPGHAPPAPRLDYGQHWKHEIWSLRTPCGEAELESPAQQEARGDPMSWCPANWYAPLWPVMRAFAMPSVADGYIRLNVCGREARGVIGEMEYGAICDRLTRDLATMVNARNGRPMVREVIRVRESPFDTDPKKPPADLIVVFHEEQPVDTVDSPLVGRIGPVPNFRSASHQAHGATLHNLMYVSGPNVQPGDSSPLASLEDVPATILALLGLPVPASFDGVARILKTPTPLA